MAFEEALVELGVDQSELDVAAARRLGRRGALLAVAGTVWRRHLGPSLTTMQVAELLGVGSRQAVHDRVRRRRLLALPTAERDLAYPAFQFSETGEPYAEIGLVLDAFADAVLSPHTVASWLVTPQAALAGSTPIEWIRDGRQPEPLVTTARRGAARVGR